MTEPVKQAVSLLLEHESEYEILSTAQLGSCESKAQVKAEKRREKNITDTRIFGACQVTI